MRIALFTRGEHYMPQNELEMWLSILDEHSIECYFNCDFALSVEKRLSFSMKSYCSVEDLPSGIEMVISYGGDGTFLKCVNMFLETGIPILGINSGRLGFLANVPKEDVSSAIQYIANGDYKIEKRPVLSVKELEALAFNEFTIQKRGLSMINIRLSINGESVADYMADGVIVSTPSGSTAYSLSLGGAIISPQCDCFIINPIAPHNLNMRPLVVEGGAEIKVEVSGRGDEIIATLDNLVYDVVSGDSFTISKSSCQTLLVKLPQVSFYKTLRNKLFWGLDTRNPKDKI